MAFAPEEKKIINESNGNHFPMRHLPKEGRAVDKRDCSVDCIQPGD